MSETEENLDEHYCGACETNPAELEDRIEKLETKLAAAERARDAFDIERRDAGDARMKAEARITKALEILDSPGMWSDFAARAKAALRGE